MFLRKVQPLITLWAIIAAVLLLLVQPAGAAPSLNVKNAPLILSAVEDIETGSLDIHGSQLIIQQACPDITLGGIIITACLITIDEPTGMQWVTISVPLALEDGAHLLRLTTPNGTANFEVTLGAIGPAGEDGIPRSKMDLYSLGCVSLGQSGATTTAFGCSCGDTEDIAIGGQCKGPPGASLNRAGTEGNSGAIQPSAKASYQCAWTKAPTEISTFIAIVDCIDVDADTIP